MQARSEPVPALVGRQRECEAVDGLVEDLRSGRGWALVMRGMAGTPAPNDAGNARALGEGAEQMEVRA